MTLQQKIWNISEKVFSSLNTIALGIITSFTPSTMRASGYLKNDKQAEFSDIPVLSLKGGLSEFLVPIEVGDVVMVLYNKHNMTGALEDNEEYTELNETKFRGLIDAVILPGVFTKADIKTFPNWNNDQIYIRTNKKVEIDSANTITLRFRRWPYSVTF